MCLLFGVLVRVLSAPHLVAAVVGWPAVLGETPQPMVLLPVSDPAPGTGGSSGVRSPVWRLLRRAWQQLLGCCFPSAAASEVMDGRCAAVTTARWKTVACVVFPVIFLFRRGLFVICGAAALACCFVILFLIQI